MNGQHYDRGLSQQIYNTQFGREPYERRRQCRRDDILTIYDEYKEKDSSSLRISRERNKKEQLIRAFVVLSRDIALL